MHKLKASLLGGIAALSIGSAAVAADMSVKAQPVYAPVPVGLGPWTGWYIGADIGYGWNWSGMDLSMPNTLLITLGNSPHGFTGGGHFGGDYQVGNLVFGIVTSLNGANFQSSNNTMNVITTGVATNWWGDVDGRIGIAAFGNHVLPYIGGGVAYGQTKANLTAVLGQPTLTNAISNTSVGWDAVAGIETRIDQHWAFFVEGKFIDLGSQQVPLTFNKNTVLTGNQKFQSGVIDGGINYRF